jgi:hypothetical protein
VNPVVTSKPLARPLALLPIAVVHDSEGHSLWYGWDDFGGSYQRGQYAAEVTGPVARFGVVTEPVGRTPFGVATTIRFMLDGVVVGSKAVLATDTTVFFDVPTAAYEGTYLMSADGVPGWPSLDYPVSIRNGAKATPQATFPVVNASYSSIHVASGPQVHQSARVPAVWKPTVLPLAPRAYPPFTSVAGRHELAFTAIAPLRPWDVYRPSYLPSGAMTAGNRQNYFYADLQSAFPLWPLREGPRGDGTITCPTSLRETLRPDGNGKVIGTDPWRVFSVDPAGTVRTVAGFVHDDPQPYTNAPRFQEHYPMPLPRFRGKWAPGTVNAKPFHELWDVAVDQDTVALDPAAAPIGGEQPHVVGVRMLVTDTQNGRIVEIVSSPTDRAAEPVLREFLTGLSNPWGEEIVGKTLYYSEQTGHRVTAVDKATGAKLWRCRHPVGDRPALHGRLSVRRQRALQRRALDLQNRRCDAGRHAVRRRDRAVRQQHEFHQPRHQRRHVLPARVRGVRVVVGRAARLSGHARPDRQAVRLEAGRRETERRRPWPVRLDAGHGAAAHLRQRRQHRARADDVGHGARGTVPRVARAADRQVRCRRCTSRGNGSTSRTATS